MYKYNPQNVTVNVSQSVKCTSYLLAELPVTDDMRSLKVRNMPLRETNLDAASDFGYW